MRRFDSQIAVVIGGGSGMGRCISHRFASDGAHVYVVDLNAESAARVVAEIVENGDRATAHTLDASDVDGIKALYDMIDATHGRLDILHHQVGIPGPPGIDIDEATFDKIWNVNAKSAFFTTTLAMPLLKKSTGSRSITITSSISGIKGSRFSPLYSLTKGSLLSFTKALALNGAPDGIRVNAICPGLFDTPMLPSFLGATRGSDLDDEIRVATSNIPLGRPGRPEEIAGVAAFLASTDASYITGVVLPVDGGVLAR